MREILISISLEGSTDVVITKQETIKRQYDTMTGTESAEMDASVHLKNKQKCRALYLSRSGIL